MHSPALRLAIDDKHLLDEAAATLQRAGFDVPVPGPEPMESDRGGVVVLSCDGTAELADAVERLSETAAVVAIVSGTRAETVAAFSAGARGVVCRNRLASTLPTTITAVLSGQLALPGEHRRLIARPSLSYRERQILGRIVAESTVAEIATELFLEPSTVKTHISSVLAKIGAQSQRHATSIVLDPERGLGRDVIVPAGRMLPEEMEASR